MNRYIFELARSLVMFNSSTEEIKEEFTVKFSGGTTQK